MNNKHFYQINTKWSETKGSGTSDYKSYSRNHTISAKNKEKINCSADPAFRGDETKYNPEELLLGAVSSCHMLWYLHLCAVNGVVILDYNDNATGIMEENGMDGGRFAQITLNTEVIVKTEDMIEKAILLHSKANKLCFIANSLNFKVNHTTNVKSI